jgi:hypothetical protein
MSELKDDIKEIKTLLKPEEKSKKDFKIPFRARTNNRLARKNYITIMKVNDNGTVDFKKTQITEQTFMEDKIPRLASAGHILRYKNNPLVILPSWSVKPFSILDSYKDSLTDGTNIKGFQLLMNAMKLNTVSDKPRVPGMVKWIIGAVIAAIIGYALLTGG